MGQAKLVELQLHRPRGFIFERDFNFKLLRLIELPTCFYFAALRVLNVYIVDAHRARCLQVDCVFAADDQGALFGGRNAPIRPTEGSEAKGLAAQPPLTPKTPPSPPPLSTHLLPFP